MNPAFIAELRTRQRQAVKSYAAGGRKFEALDEEALEPRFVTALKAWCTYPTHPDTGRELNDTSCEFLLRHLPVPDEPLILHLDGFLPVAPVDPDSRPAVAVAVVVFRESSPPGWPAIYAPHWGLLLSPRGDRYGDFFETVKARRAAGETS